MSRLPYLCTCGTIVTTGRCRCQALRDRVRKALHDHNRPSARERGYDTRWQQERAAYLLTHPTCRRCPKPATTLDHINPHRGNMVIFWDRSNWQPLCTKCHSMHKQRQELRDRK